MSTSPRLSLSSLFLGTAIISLIFLQFASWGFTAIAILAIENTIAALGLLLYNKLHSANLAIATALLIYFLVVFIDYDAPSIGEAIRYTWPLGVAAAISQVLAVFSALTTTSPTSGDAGM